MTRLYMMIGLPASGKSTIAKEISESEDAVIVSSDEIRREYGDVNDQSQNAKVFKEVGKRLKENIENGRNVIFDATNVSYKKRRAWLERFNRYNVEKIAILVATPYEECLKRNTERDRNVPKEVITRMYHNFYIPQEYEGFDDIQIIYNFSSINKIKEFYQLQDLEQDNPHHTLSVKQHCRKAADLINRRKDASESLWLATLFHDIGKLKTKTFTNMKGETTEIAHYYNHEKVSAYDSLFMFPIWKRLQPFACNYERKEALYILKLIQWHMIMHFNLSEKTITKYRKLLGESTWNDLEILHKADCEAR